MTGSPSRRAPLLATIGLLVLAALGGGAYYALQEPSTPGEASRDESRLEERPAQAVPPPGTIAAAPPLTTAANPSLEEPQIKAPGVTEPEVKPVQGKPPEPAPRVATPTPSPSPAPPRVASAPPPERVAPPSERVAPQPSVQPAPRSEPSAPPVATVPAPAVTEPAPAPQREALAVPPSIPTPSIPAPSPIERVANYVRDYRGGDCFYLSPTSVGAHEASIEAYGAATASFAAFDGAFTSAQGFDAQIQLHLVSAAQCAVVDLLARQAQQRRAKVPKLSLDRDRMRSGEQLSGTLDLGTDPNAELLLVDDEGEVHNLARNLKRSGQKITFALRLQAPAGQSTPQLVVAIASAESLAFLKIGARTRADDLFRVLADEASRPGSPIGVAVRYLKLGE